MKNREKYINILQDIDDMPLNKKDNEIIMKKLEELEDGYNEVRKASYMKFYYVLHEIENTSLSDDEKESIARKLQEIESDYDRLKKSTDMKIDVLEKEKNILLDNYIRKDNDVNYLYNIIQKLNSSKIYRFYKKIRKVEDGF